MIVAIDPTRMTPEQCLNEIAEILASGILRLRLKKAQHNENREHFSLDNANQIGPYGTPINIDNKRETP